MVFIRQNVDYFSILKKSKNILIMTILTISFKNCPWKDYFVYQHRLSMLFSDCFIYFFPMLQAFTELSNINSKVKLENSQKFIRGGINNPI